MAVVLPLLFMLLMGIFWFGQAFRVYGTLTQSARAGARAAVAPVCATCAPFRNGPGQYAQTAVQNAMVAASLNTNQFVPVAQWTVPPPALNQCGTLAPALCDGTVTVPSVFRRRSVILSGAGGKWAGRHMGTCGTAGRYALQVLPVQDPRHQSGPQYHSASRRGADESRDAMTKARR